MQFTTVQGRVIDATPLHFDDIPIQSHFTVIRPGGLNGWSFVGHRLLKISENSFTSGSMTYERSILFPLYLVPLVRPSNQTAEFWVNRCVIVSKDFEGRKHFPGGGSEWSDDLPFLADYW